MYTGAEARGDRREDQERHSAAGRRTGRRHPVLATLAALVLAGLSVPLAVRAAGSDGVTPVPQLLAFLPWFLAPTWLALLGAALARRPLLLVWGLAVLAATGWFLQPYGSTAPDGAAGRQGKAQFRVLTSNLQRGGALPDLLETVRRERPQIVSIQECDSACADALRTPELRKAYPHRVIADGRPAEGSALLSVYPLGEKSEVPARLAMPGAVAKIGGEEVRLQVAHPMPPDLGELGPWRTELGRLRSYAASGGDRPTLIAGDFNSSADHAAFRAVLDTGLHDTARMLGQSRTPTWPATTAPPLGTQIDHVLVSRQLVPLEAKFLDFAGTDHRALLVDLKLF
ncbi:endonuclease/exonuclease/phosphatase family protein [Streptomyces iconiensis]|uniref:Endonuclease/exonuclease/phosphatase family protein n=1 Tax=Streptomyces iconiensis TaxID=1384038 RepID=A0ABT7A6E6_9ACTN|nr:endonuclease/exonuclease/phosphatase family protein [Streptomyces iconiensis]MDJ1136907.1 endonuclease/exonuclease/phosphatase family protein [Streptomyces iconiensis]